MFCARIRYGRGKVGRCVGVIWSGDWEGRGRRGAGVEARTLRLRGGSWPL